MTTWSDTTSESSVPLKLRDSVTAIGAAVQKLSDLDTQRTAAHAALVQAICEAKDLVQVDPELPLSRFQRWLVAELLRFPDRLDDLERLVARAGVFEVNITQQVGSYGLLYDDRGGLARLTLLRLSGPLWVTDEAEQIEVPATVVTHGTIRQAYVWSIPSFNVGTRPNEPFAFKAGTWVDIILGQKRHSGGTGYELVIGRDAVLAWIAAFKFTPESEKLLRCYL